MTANPKHDAVTADLPCHEYGYAADVDKAEASDAISAKNAEITRLREQLAEAERQRDAEYERAESQAALVNCACCYDEPTDLCEAHKRVLDRLVADQRDAAQAEALEKAANRIEWCGGLIHQDKARDKASEWAEEARAAAQKEGE